jgi:hypothetical protein
MDNAVTNVSSPGQVIIDKVQLISNNGFIIDLRPFMVDITITESINDIFVSGLLSLTESLNLIRFAPIIGNEYVNIVFYTPGRRKIDYTFYVSRVSKRILENKTTTYYLELSSIGAITSTYKAISTSFSNMTYSEMAQSIYSDFLKQENTKFSYYDTKYKKNYTCGYKLPAEILADLASFAADTEGNKNYVFFETLNNDYIFRPLFEINTPSVFQYSNFFAGLAGINTLLEYTRIRELEVYDTGDIKKNIAGGVFGSWYLSVDTTYKEITEVNKSYHDLFSEVGHVNQFPIFPKANQFISSAPGDIDVFPKASYNYDNIKDNENYGEVISGRNFQLVSSNSYSLGINVLGDSDRHPGDKVTVFIQSPQATDIDDEKDDPYLSGYYTISKIKHLIRPEQYQTNILLIKDSNWKPVKEEN